LFTLPLIKKYSIKSEFTIEQYNIKKNINLIFLVDF